MSTPVQGYEGLNLSLQTGIERLNTTGKAEMTFSAGDIQFLAIGGLLYRDQIQEAFGFKLPDPKPDEPKFTVTDGEPFAEIVVRSFKDKPPNTPYMHIGIKTSMGPEGKPLEGRSVRAKVSKKPEVKETEIETDEIGLWISTPAEGKGLLSAEFIEVKPDVKLTAEKMGLTAQISLQQQLYQEYFKYGINKPVTDLLTAIAKAKGARSVSRINYEITKDQQVKVTVFK